MPADTGNAAGGAVAEVAEFELAGRGCRLTAAQHSSQTRGQFAWVAGLGQIVVGTEFEAENAIQRFATAGQHQHRQVRMFAAQLLEQFRPLPSGSITSSTTAAG